MNTLKGKKKSKGLPAELFTDEVVVVLKRLCADSGEDVGHHSALIHDGGVQHCVERTAQLKTVLNHVKRKRLVHQVNAPLAGCLD